MPDIDNGIVPSPTRLTAAQGQAALVLAESLLHGLLEQSILTTRQSYDIVSSAIDVQTAFAEQEPADPHQMEQARLLLIQIARSLEVDL